MENKSTTGQLLTRFLIICAVLFAAQWLIPYYLLAAGALIGGIFIMNTARDRREGYVILAAAIFIAVVGYLSMTYGEIFRK